MINNHISEKLNNISSSPGVYKFFDKSNNVIYIGKAKNLYKRVRSYFTGYKSDEKGIDSWSSLTASLDGYSSTKDEKLEVALFLASESQHRLRNFYLNRMMYL